MATLSQIRPHLYRVWFLLALPPLLFLSVIIAASIFVGIQTQGDASAIAIRVPAMMPILLCLVQFILLVMFQWNLRADGLRLKDIGWNLRGANVPKEILSGVIPGIVLAVVYITLLAPWLENIQRSIGDYVPPGELMPTLGNALVPFFIANVLLAPFVEENIYRGFALTRLEPRYGLPLAVVISCIFFGLLHWAGGFWYILLTGVVAGGLFCGLFVWRKNIIAPFAAHLALNIIEFLFIAFARG